MGVDLNQLSSDEILRTIQRLDQIGIRFAGTRAEQQAADWIETEFQRLGLTNIRQQPFPCLSFSCDHCSVEILTEQGWKAVPSEAAAHCPSTPWGGIEGELLTVERIPSTLLEAKRKIADRVVLLYNSEFFQFPVFQRLMRARPKALLVVDDRFPNDWTVAVGFPRYWVDYISCPVINISHSHAWQCVRDGASRVRMNVRTEIRKSNSQNVIGEIEGSDRAKEILVISGHHDTVINSSGVDDNATGVAAVIELARLFSRTSPRRTLRFISYGTEEQLSEGARHYALHAEDLDRILFVLNVDSIGAWMGKTGIYYCGPVEIERLVRRVSMELDFEAQVVRELSPFSDHFPLNCSGIPAVWYYRTTFAGARHYHHSRNENMSVLSPEVLRKTVRHQAALLDRMAQSDRMLIPREIPKGQMTVLKKWAKEWCGCDFSR